MIYKEISPSGMKHFRVPILRGLYDERLFFPEIFGSFNDLGVAVSISDDRRFVL